MNRDWRWLFVLAPLVLIAVAVASTPLLGGGYDSVTEALLRDLHRVLLVVAVPLFVAVQVALFYAVLKFHGRDEPAPTREDRRLEVALTVGTAIVLLFTATASYVVLADPFVATSETASPDADDVHVEVTGQNWFWTFSYPGENVTTDDVLVLPANRTVFLTVTSEDVIHSVHVPALGIKQDAIPGQKNTVRTELTSEGTYRLYCAEFCGTGHSKMLATVKVVSEEEYRAWLEDQRAENGTEAGDGATNDSTSRAGGAETTEITDSTDTTEITDSTDPTDTTDTTGTTSTVVDAARQPKLSTWTASSSTPAASRASLTVLQNSANPNT